MRTLIFTLLFFVSQFGFSELVIMFNPVDSTYGLVGGVITPIDQPDDIVFSYEEIDQLIHGLEIKREEIVSGDMVYDLKWPFVFIREKSLVTSYKMLDDNVILAADPHEKSIIIPFYIMLACHGLLFLMIITVTKSVRRGLKDIKKKKAQEQS